MAVQLNTTTYSDLISGVNSILGSGQYRAVTITFFDDAAGTAVSKDSNGNNLLNRAFSSTTSKAETKDEADNIINGSVTISFNDGLEFTLTDNVNTLWYTLSGISIFSR
jgi:hypothetical protein